MSGNTGGADRETQITERRRPPDGPSSQTRAQQPNYGTPTATFGGGSESLCGSSGSGAGGAAYRAKASARDKREDAEAGYEKNGAAACVHLKKRNEKKSKGLVKWTHSDQSFGQ